MGVDQVCLQGVSVIPARLLPGTLGLRGIPPPAGTSCARGSALANGALDPSSPPLCGPSHGSAGEWLAMGNAERLSGLDASFLALEKRGAHMHVGSVLIFAGTPPPYDELVEEIGSRLHLVPRYRRRLAYPPFGVSRPVWVDDPHFNVRYHLRHTALPDPAGPDELQALVGRLFSQQLDRDKPLWEIWLVDRVGADRFALVCKTHHAMVDGVSGVDILTVLLDAS